MNYKFLIAIIGLVGFGYYVFAPPEPTTLRQPGPVDPDADPPTLRRRRTDLTEPGKPPTPEIKPVPTPPATKND